MVANGWVLVAIGISCMVSIPLIFEASTFHLYSINDPSFFTFSGSRLWIDLAVLVTSGFLMGPAAGIRSITKLAIVAIGVTALILLFYHFCDERQCYYAMPDGFGELRLAMLFFAAACTGVMLGIPPKLYDNFWDSVVFGATTAIFLGYYPYALLFGTCQPGVMGLVILSIASSVPFFLSGVIGRYLSREMTSALLGASIAWIVLTLLFLPIRPSYAPIAAAMILGALPFALAGFKIAPRLNSRSPRTRPTAMGLIMLTVFSLSAVHPFLDAPMNLSLGSSEDPLAQPTAYSGAYHQSDHYFPTKRVEVTVIVDQVNSTHLKEYLVAGLGVQSPNCCKDGLDYGYRADLFFNRSGVFLAARAWETCDHNVACSGLPWISMMHESVSNLPRQDGRVALAMEWQKDDRTVIWFYRTEGSDWQEFSRFRAPRIENPYFNLGVIEMGNPVANPDWGSAQFYQVGASLPRGYSPGGQVSFYCPAYYDAAGKKHCAEFEPVSAGNSHWKVLWKWGIQGDKDVRILDGSEVSIELE